MAVPANTAVTFGAKSIREDLDGVIYRIDPTEVPFTNNIGKDKAAQTYTEWQVETLAAATDANAVLEGDDATVDAANEPVRVGNYTQISDKVASVSGSREAATHAGYESKLAHEVLLKGLELRRDVEKQMLSNKPSVAGGAGTARQSAGFESWLTTNVNRGATGANGGFAGSTVAAPTDGTLRSFTEAQIKDVQQKCFTSGGEPTMLMLPPTLKQAFSAFTGIAVNRVTNSGKDQVSIVGGADVYVGDFGTLTVTPSRLMRSRSALFVDPKRVKMAAYRPMKNWELAKTGDSEKRQILIEYTLKVVNEAAHGVIADIQP